MALAQQGRLADSGFTLDKENLRASRKLTEETGDLGSLCIPPYEHRLHLCCQLQPGGWHCQWRSGSTSRSSKKSAKLLVLASISRSASWWSDTARTTSTTGVPAIQ